MIKCLFLLRTSSSLPSFLPSSTLFSLSSSYLGCIHLLVFYSLYNSEHFSYFFSSLPIIHPVSFRISTPIYYLTCYLPFLSFSYTLPSFLSYPIIFFSTISTVPLTYILPLFCHSLPSLSSSPSPHPSSLPASYNLSLLRPLHFLLVYL